MDGLDALADALAVEHAAVFAYGLVAAFAREDRAAEVAEAVAAHRTRRDETTERLRAAGTTPPVAEPGYAVPLPVSDPVTAAQLGVQVEESVATAWWAVLGAAEPGELRGVALAALTDAALRASRWRTALGLVPATVAFPGQPPA